MKNVNRILTYLFLLFLLAGPLLTVSAQRGADYQTIAEDGAWCWFSDPRAVYHAGEHERTYTGFITSTGDIVIRSQDHQTGEHKSRVLYEKLEVDDHANPSVLVLPDGRIMVFFNKHGGTIYYATTQKNEDISTFGPVDSLDLGPRTCYTNAVLLREEDDRIYLFHRGGEDWKPTFVTSDDLGKTWSEPQVLVTKATNDPFNRPYTKVVSDGKSNIYFAFTDGHPREENHNSLYFLRYEWAKFYDASGQVVGTIDQLPLQQESLKKAFDGKVHNQRAWIWDIAVTADHHPVMVFTTHPEETQHFYYYSRWNGSEWQHTRLCEAGSAFPRFERPKEMPDPEPHYSGGIVIDHQNPNKVFLSRPHQDRFELEEWTTADAGKTFTQEAVTQHSLHDNVRPFVVRNAPAELMPRVLWMHVEDYKHWTNYHTAIKGNQMAEGYSPKLTETAIVEVMGAVADWQIDYFHLVPHHPLDWTNGALFAGMMAWAKIAPNDRALNWLYDIGRRHAWQPHYRVYHADDVVVSRMYLEMYEQKPDEKYRYRMLAPTKARLDYVVANPSQGTLLLDYSDPQTLERWTWCDALFMAPPIYVKMTNITGDAKYLEFMDEEFKVTYDFLYDQDEHLFYRDHRFFPEKKREANGEKIFWGRGNGWVMGGLVSILTDLPEDSEYRPFYEKLYQEMAAKVAKCQGESGFWHASMLDHESFPNPEASSSGFFCYALAYGINSGLLEEDIYRPVVTKAWQALVSAVYPDGKLGWVQPIGEDPKKVTAEMTEVYGVGAFLLAGSEMLKLAE